MNPDPDFSGASFAFLSSGANFSCEVLQALLQKNYPPKLLVLPEYAPAGGSTETDNRLITAIPQRRLLTLAQGIEIAYAPAQRQTECARLVESRGIDFLLVACWPYLIATRLIESAGRAALNLHPSLLPKYRGPDPLEQQLTAGESIFGISLHLLDQRFDHGDIIAQAELSSPVVARQRSILERQCAGRGAELFVEAVAAYPDWKPLAQTD